ncbi:major facilitator superfamily domain-containing protein [Pestalotiopsis sp. NC0098]|nr:major facilitator superfamily domain-containing protein [Pestalotiopsis sp. NC0098]
MPPQIPIATSEMNPPLQSEGIGAQDPIIPNPPIPHTEKTNAIESPVEESLQARIDRLGRQRPPAFPTAWSEVTFVFSIAMSQFLTEFFVSGFTVILPTLIRELDIPQASSVWPATAFSLVIASTLLIFGRLGDIWGGYPVFLWGLSWLLIWSIIAGFSINPLMLDFCRALQGLGAAAFIPTGVMLMGSIYRPGRRKNLVFAIYGTSAVFGFFGGILVAGIVGQFLRWGFYFWIGGILTAMTLLSSIFSISKLRSEKTTSKDTKMDYPGALTIVVGLTLTVFAITQSAHAPSGWRTPYILVCFFLGILSLLAAGYVETYVAPDPLLPSSMFTTPAMTPLLVGLLLLYGTWGIFSVYGTLYFQNIMLASPLQVVAWYVPLGAAGLLFSILEGYILHLVPGRVLLVISGLGAVGSQLLLALIPLEEKGYWAFVFPATILSTVGIDISTILATVFNTTAFPAAQQGLAGGVINSVLQLGVALVLGLTDIIQSATVDEAGLGVSYKNTFWFGVGAGAAGLLVLAIWGRVPKAESELTEEEKRELMQEAVCEDIGKGLGSQGGGVVSQV